LPITEYHLEISSVRYWTVRTSTLIVASPRF